MLYPGTGGASWCCGQCTAYRGNSDGQYKLRWRLINTEGKAKVIKTGWGTYLKATLTIKQQCWFKEIFCVKTTTSGGWWWGVNQLIIHFFKASIPLSSCYYFHPPSSSYDLCLLFCIYTSFTSIIILYFFFCCSRWSRVLCPTVWRASCPGWPAGPRRAQPPYWTACPPSPRRTIM